jgi:hypothetical protein
MSDPTTKILTETAAQLFTVAEKKRFRQMGVELQGVYQTLGDFDPGKLAQQLGNAHAGLDPTGAKLDGMDDRLAAVAKIQQAINEGPARIGHAREVERALFSEAKSPAHKLLTAAIAQAERLVQNPPALPTPGVLSEWGVSIDLGALFVAAIAAAKQSLSADLADDYSRRGSPEVGFHRLSRAGLTTTEK